MADTAKRAAPAGQVWWGRLDETEEGRRLLANPESRAALEAGRQAPTISTAELDQHLGLTPEDIAAGEAELDRLLAAEEGAEG